MRRTDHGDEQVEERQGFDKQPVRLYYWTETRWIIASLGDLGLPIINLKDTGFAANVQSAFDPR